MIYLQNEWDIDGTSLDINIILADVKNTLSLSLALMMTPPVRQARNDGEGD